MKRATSNAAIRPASARAYTSPTLVLLAMDWADGATADDFLGFAILRAPGFAKGEQDGYLLNKVAFQPMRPDSQPLPSNIAPIQKFLWWDPSVTRAAPGQSFTYTITPARGTGPKDLRLEHNAEVTLRVQIPAVSRDGISTWFNRAVVSSQAFTREFPDPQKDLANCMDWLANGIEDAFTEILKGATAIDGAIYHLTDNHWVVPALKAFPGDLTLVYEKRKNDSTDDAAIRILDGRRAGHFEAFPRAATNIMHDKFLIDVRGERVLMGSANFTPEALTSQANLLHIFNSRDLAGLYEERQKLLRDDPSVKDTANQGAGWSDPISLGQARVRVFFSPEPGKNRESIDTVVKAVNQAKQSVAFCMFDPTDPALLKALMAVGDKGKLLYGLLNSISDPTKSKKKKNADDNLSDSGEAPRQPSPATQIKVTLFNRSRKDKKILPYSYFQKSSAPADFLPEFSTVDLSSMSTLKPRPAAGGKKKGGPPAVHVHHKFIIIDAETDSPTIYTGSNNLSNNSTHRNDESLLEITGAPELAQTYFAEFMRLYEHYRARAIWNQNHPKGAGAGGGKKDSATGKGFTLATKRDGWVRGAYKKGTPEFIARTTLAN